MNWKIDHDSPRFGAGAMENKKYGDQAAGLSYRGTRETRYQKMDEMVKNINSY